MSKGWEIIGMGSGAGLILYLMCVKFSIKFFVLVIGFLTGFCLTNTLEAIFVYKFRNSEYSEYYVGIGFFMVLASYYHYNLFNSMFSYCGAYFICKAFSILAFNDQLADLKQFINDYGFNNYDDIELINDWYPYCYTGGQLVLFILF